MILWEARGCFFWLEKKRTLRKVGKRWWTLRIRRDSYSDSSLEDVTEFLLFRTANRWSGLKDVSHQRLERNVLAPIFSKRRYLYNKRSSGTPRIWPISVPPRMAGSGCSSRAFFSFLQQWSKHACTCFHWNVERPTSFVVFSGSRIVLELDRKMIIYLQCREVHTLSHAHSSACVKCRLEYNQLEMNARNRSSKQVTDLHRECVFRTFHS